MQEQVAGQRVAYVRVSSADQNTARQIAEIGECDYVFTEYASGKDVDGRPQLEAMIDYVRPGDHVVVASMDRLARSVIDLNDIVQQITGDPEHHKRGQRRKGASLQFLKEALTFRPKTSDPSAQFQLNLMGSFAQFERDLIRQRQREGIDAAKARGVYKGRAKALSEDDLDKARQKLADGVPKTRVAAELQVGRTTLYRALARDTESTSAVSATSAAGGGARTEG